jgi:hypothetical protein
MGSGRGMSREVLAALVSEYRGDLDAAAAAVGTTRGALLRRVQRAGLSMRLPRWGPGAVPAPTAAGSSPAYALAALELAVENEGLKAALVGAEGVIDHLTGKVAEMAEMLGATR